MNVSDAGGHDRRSKYGSEPLFGDFLFDLTNKLVGEFDMASSSTLRSLSAPPRVKYCTFLSFRGLETRHAFTDHLYKALKDENIHVFRDDEELPRGGVIHLELKKAIKASQYAIIVLSENYADSEWCLNELAEIMECREKMGLTVLPVFYHVKPSHVREQKGTFVIDRDEYEKISAEMKQKWKKALKDVADLAGIECTDRR